ncbi:hypothetical protein EVAR_3049_1 [Eumeta japonica]|uniref:Mos1 transposase HTH domain-containing protein n=1 Tax=Eumeta variegata TaxID=151549 RepID=A0A4C1SWD1_EUMVA|nr:hypothetical protein EVAR_3049_1 [Eumeta japonica]
MKRMKCDKCTICVLLRHYWKQKAKAAEATRKICEIEDEVTVSEQTPQPRFNSFLYWRLDAGTSFMLWSPTCIIWDIEATKKALENQPSTNTSRLSDSLAVPKDTIHRHLK